MQLTTASHSTVYGAALEMERNTLPKEDKFIVWAILADNKMAEVLRERAIMARDPKATIHVAMGCELDKQLTIIWELRWSYALYGMESIRVTAINSPSEDPAAEPSVIGDVTFTFAGGHPPKTEASTIVLSLGETLSDSFKIPVCVHYLVGDKHLTYMFTPHPPFIKRITSIKNLFTPKHRKVAGSIQ